jgi:hypothetical protein
MTAIPVRTRQFFAAGEPCCGNEEPCPEHRHLMPQSHDDDDVLNRPITDEWLATLGDPPF